MTSIQEKTASEAIGDLLRILEPHCGQDEATLDGAGFDAMVLSLVVIRRMALATEREVGAFRLLFEELSLEDTATNVAADIVRDPEGKVITPDFGRRS